MIARPVRLRCVDLGGVCRSNRRASARGSGYVETLDERAGPKPDAASTP